MASILGNRAAAQLAFREGANATQALSLFRAAGGSIRTQTWYRLYGQAQLEGTLASKELAANPQRIPTAGEIQTASVPRARGYLQRVTVYGSDAEGNIISKQVSMRANRLVSRQNAINKALALVQAGMDDPERADRYPLKALLMGTYSATFSLEPEAG